MQMIQFDKKVINIVDVIKIGFTKTAFDALKNDVGENWDLYMVMLSQLKHFIVVPYENSLKKFYLHTPTSILLCAIDKKSNDEFSVTAYLEKDLELQNKKLKYGINFYSNQGFCLKYISNDIKFKYISGKRYDYDFGCMNTSGKRYDYDFGCMNTSESFHEILNVLKEANKEKKTNRVNQAKKKLEADDIGKPLNQMLDLAEQYAELSSEVDERKAQELGKIGYLDFHAISYDRADRIAYEFLVDPFDQSAFKEGVQVEIQGKDQQRISGEIISLDISDEKKLKITILFNKQMDFHNLPVPGWISLSFSTVNKDVQLEAIDKIRNKTAASEYLEDVFGANQPKGFDEIKDVNAVIERLQGQKNPPNESQMKAIDRGIRAKDVYLVMGPPGTGKTTIILEWVKYFTGKGLRVLISSQNNKAVDNVLSRLTEEKNIDMIRIGSETKIQPEIIPYMFENKLNDMSRNIEETTDSVLNRLDKTLTDWKEYQDSLLKYKDQLCEISAAENTLRGEIEKYIIPVERKKSELLTKYEDAARKKKKIAVEMAQCSEAVKIYESKGSVLKKLLKRSNEKRVNRLEELASQTRQSWQYLRDLESQYRIISASGKKQAKNLKASFMSQVEPAMLWVTGMRNSIDAVRPMNPGFASLFESIHPEKNGLPYTDGYSLDQLLLNLHNEMERCKIIRNHVIDWRNLVVNRQNYALNEIVLESVNVVGATCIGVNSQKRFADLHFDVTIIDEAGQIQLQNALVPMSVSNKLIMLGDHKQIPPLPDKELLDLCDENDVDPELLEKSLFEKMFMTLPATNTMMLDTQYRMPGEIADVLSNWFYNNNYRSPEFKRELQSLLPQISKRPFIIIDTSCEKDRKEKKTSAGGTYNPLESDICSEIISYIDQSNLDIDWNEIGIISAYKDQVGKIIKTIKKTVGGEMAEEMAATLTSFQGQERDLILYSFTRSSHKSQNASRIGFLQELRFLNVAMSRCKKTLVMVGDMKFLSECERRGKDENGRYIDEKEFSEFIRTLLAAVNSGSGEILTCSEFRKRIGA